MKNKILNLLKNTYCRLAPSRTSGVGVFAIKDIKKGVDPFYGVKIPKWHKFHMDELKKIDKPVLKMINDFFVIEKDRTVYIPETGLNGLDVSYFLNHSNTPNLKIVGDGKDSAQEFVTSRKIRRGEELTVSYATYDEKYIK